MGAAVDLSSYPRRIRESTATLTGFCPDGIPYQREVIQLIRRDFDYSLGNLEILLSGSYGSAKSSLLAHLAVTHCLMFNRSRVAICRRALPDIKATIFKEIIEHIETDLVEGVDYTVNRSTASIRFRNGSEIVSVYWADKRYKRIRSLKLSMVIIEEATENDDDDRQAFKELRARLRRLRHVPENVLICATNPDSPAHWLYTTFIEPNEGGKTHPTIRVFYSVTDDNIYLPPIYTEQLRAGMTPREALRYLEGRWIELVKDKIYYEYDPNKNFINDAYQIKRDSPIYLSFDFNIGVGKPMSMCCFQYIDDSFHYFTEAVIDGARTEDIMDDLANRGVLSAGVPHYIVCGDASGKHRDTRNKFDDYQIITSYLEAKQINYLKWVPVQNPALRTRHNKVNAYCQNANGQRRLFVYADAPTLHRGFRLVELKKGGDYVEDEKPFQHVTTAAGYGLIAAITWGNRSEQRTRNL